MKPIDERSTAGYIATVVVPVMVVALVAAALLLFTIGWLFSTFLIRDASIQ